MNTKKYALARIFMIRNNWKLTKGPDTGNWLNELSSVHSVGYWTVL